MQGLNALGRNLQYDIRDIHTISISTTTQTLICSFKKV